jgi:agmatinase
MTVLASPVPSGRPTFLDVPRCVDLPRLEADVTVLGVRFTTPHDLASSRAPESAAPAAVREQSWRYAGQTAHHDFDLGGPLFAGHRVHVVDAGDVAAVPGRYQENAERTAAVIETIVGRGSLPVIIGGDRAAALPLLRVLSARHPIGVVHLGAEVDWRDEVDGVRGAAPSTMRRAAELEGVVAMAQIGLRGAGHSRPGDIADARRWGSVLVPAHQVRETGASAALDRAPAAPRYVLCLDIGALDPAVAPGVEFPAFGGLTYYEVITIAREIAARGAVAGLALTGIAPDRDLHGMTSLLGARLILATLGALAHAGRLGTTQDTGAVGMVGVAPSRAGSHAPAPAGGRL